MISFLLNVHYFSKWLGRLFNEVFSSLRIIMNKLCRSSSWIGNFLHMFVYDAKFCLIKSSNSTQYAYQVVNNGVTGTFYKTILCTSLRVFYS